MGVEMTEDEMWAAYVGSARDAYVAARDAYVERYAVDHNACSDDALRAYCRFAEARRLHEDCGDKRR